MTTSLAIRLFLVALASWLVSFCVGVALRRKAPWVRLIDTPNDRSLHSIPTPRGGGLGIVAGVAGGLLALPWCGVALPPDVQVVLIAGGALVAGVGLMDDVKSLPAVGRLAIHVLVAFGAVAIVGGVQELRLPTGSGIALGAWALPVAILWIAGMINVYNFMDGIDGLAAGQAVIAGLGWLLIGAITNDPVLWGPALLVTASSAGFLVHNWSPARLFMGDVGSTFLGYFFAIEAVLATRRHPSVSAAGVLLLWPFLLDATLTLVRRTVRGEQFWAAHRSHLYQRLVAGGLSHGQVTIIYLVLAMMAVGAALIATFRPAADVWVAAYAGGSAIALWCFVWWRETRTVAPSNSRLMR
jgi:UDP-N-acetylmuramyl pentapeptide phosphotransferase/UDP-N-acetylglucosamine-1-phosphate transferase